MVREKLAASDAKAMHAWQSIFVMPPRFDLERLAHRRCVTGHQVKESLNNILSPAFA